MYINGSNALKNEYFVHDTPGKKAGNEANTGDEANNTYNEGSNILGFKEADDSVNAANDCAQENLNNDLNDLGKAFIHFCNLVVHFNKLQSAKN